MFSSFFYCACDLIKKKQFIVSIWAGCTYLHWISSGKGLTKDNPPQPHNNIWLPFGLCIFPTLFSLRLHECPLKFWLRYGLAGLKRRMNLWQGVHFQCCCPHGHKTVPLLFVNCVSSPPGLPYSFFQHFFSWQNWSIYLLRWFWRIWIWRAITSDFLLLSSIASDFV